MNKTELSLSEKYALSITEAAAYFNISERRFRTFISDYIYADFILMNGNKVLIKRHMLEEFFDGTSSL